MPTRYVALLETRRRAARRYDPRVVAVNAHVTDELQEVWIATSDGRFVHDRRPMVTLGVQVVASDKRERGSGYVGDGGRTSIAYFDAIRPKSWRTEAARIATVNLAAVPAPAGEMEMIVGAGGGGVLLHEAVGHGLESDFNRRGTSLYSGRVGERVASELVTIYDDGNLPEERGSLNVDDEGVPGQHKVLVENGVLRGYMQDRAQRAADGRRVDRQRTAPVVSLPAAAAHVQHVHAQRQIDASTRSSHRRSAGSMRSRLPADKSRSARAISSSWSAKGYLIENGKITAPVQERDDRRQRPRGDDEGRGRRQRQPAGAPPLHVRQGRPVRSRRASACRR